MDGSNVSDRVTYRLAGGKIIRDFSSPWGGGPWPAATPSDLADKVTGLSFTYRDSTGTVTATLANIRRITITVTVEETKAGRTETFQPSIDVRLRNLS